MCHSHARSASCPEGLSGTAEARSPRQQIRRTQARWSELIFAAKTTASALIALLVAFTFNFDQPQWALLIVFIVAQPQSGLVWAKSFYRIVGIFIGAGVALLFVALFAQERVPFLGALALWIGLCCVGFQYARNFTTYSFALSGYTAIIVGIPGALDAGNAVNRDGAPRLDRSGGFGYCGTKARLGRRIGSLEPLELPGETLRDVDDTDQRRVEKPEGVAPVADIAILKHRRSPQVLNCYRLAQKLHPQRRGVAGAEKCNGIVSQSVTLIGDCLPQRRGHRVRRH
jgi:hypothetical protein